MTISAVTRVADVNLAPATYFAIQPEYEHWIQAKTKKIEGRLFRGAAAKVKVGDLLLLGLRRARVTHIT